MTTDSTDTYMHKMTCFDFTKSKIALRYRENENRRRRSRKLLKFFEIIRTILVIFTIRAKGKDNSNNNILFNRAVETHTKQNRKWCNIIIIQTASYFSLSRFIFQWMKAQIILQWWRSGVLCYLLSLCSRILYVVMTL